MNTVVKIGEAKNKEKLLELGKEIVNSVFERFESNENFKYINEKDIDKDILVSIGQTLYSNKEMFEDYTKGIYDEEGFDWVNSEVNSIDFIYEIVDKKLNSSPKYYFDDNIKGYVENIAISEENIEEKIIAKMKETEERKFLVVVLDKSNEEYIFIDYSNLEIKYKCFINSEEKTSQGIIFDNKEEALKDISKCISDIVSRCKKVKEAEAWSDKIFAIHLWEYFNDDESFENISKYIQNNHEDVYKNIISSLTEKLGTIIDISKNSIKRELSLYHNGFMDCLEENYQEAKEILWDVIHDNFKDTFKPDENYRWHLKGNSEIFKSDVERRLNLLMEINTFDLPEVLPKEVEFKILDEYIKEEVVYGVERMYSKYGGYSDSDFFWQKTEENKELYLKGSLMNLTDEEVLSLFKDSIDEREIDSIDYMHRKYLRGYLQDVLVKRNDKDNKLFIMATYHILLDKLDKLEPYLDKLFKNGFTLDILEHKIKNMPYKLYEKLEAGDYIEGIFKSYLSKSNTDCPDCVAIEDL